MKSLPSYDALTFDQWWKDNSYKFPDADLPRYGHEEVARAAWEAAQKLEAPSDGPVRGEAGDWIDAVVLDICEIPDRTSPDDEPEIMLVKADELRRIILANLPVQRT
jgi:hypothetical protein